MLSCRQKAGFVGQHRGVRQDGCCENFYPTTNFKLNLHNPRRIPLTRGKFALVDEEDYYRLSRFNWHTLLSSKTFYAVAKPLGKKKIKMHRMIMAAPDHLVVDHIDHNGLNNRRSNLRLCSAAQNARNSVSSCRSSSKYKGVSWHRDKKKWSVYISLNNKSYYLGAFANEIEAAKAYDEKAKELHGQFACLNFPPVASKL